VIVLSNRLTGSEEAAGQAAAATPSTPVATAASLEVARASSTPLESAALPWLLLGSGLVLVLVAALLATVWRRRQRRVAQDTALLERSVPHGIVASALPSVALSSAAVAPAPSSVAAVAPGPPISSRVAAVVANDRAARSAPPPSGVSMPPISERQWLSQRPPRGDREPER
jgi:hypothetical protein